MSKYEPGDEIVFIHAYSVVKNIGSEDIVMVKGMITGFAYRKPYINYDIRFADEELTEDIQMAIVKINRHAHYYIPNLCSKAKVYIEMLKVLDK